MVGREVVLRLIVERPLYRRRLFEFRLRLHRHGHRMAAQSTQFDPVKSLPLRVVAGAQTAVLDARAPRAVPAAATLPGPNRRRLRINTLRVRARLLRGQKSASADSRNRIRSKKVTITEHASPHHLIGWRTRSELAPPDPLAHRLACTQRWVIEQILTSAGALSVGREGFWYDSIGEKPIALRIVFTGEARGRDPGGNALVPVPNRGRHRAGPGS